MTDVLSIENIRSASLGLSNEAFRTPLLESFTLNEKLGCRLLVKAETLQRTGSFKFRGAFNKISNIPKKQRKYGIVAFSSGNHAQGVAAAAKKFGINTKIIMPKDAPKIKIANTRAYGAEILFYDRSRDDRRSIGEKIVKKTGAVLVHPFDDPLVVAGQGTVGLEVAEQAQALNVTLDDFLAPCGGGGLISGCALALKTESPKTEIHSVEPVGFDYTARSLAAKKRIKGTHKGTSICDALLSLEPGKISHSLNAKLLKSCITVTDEMVIEAMKVAFQYFKLVVEPGGAAALAGVLSGQFKVYGRTLAVVLSGGNVDPGKYRKVLDID
tara:strand:+ start:461 stop:1441 length:981 start_codon:yes stop_codon:yes gene_type:complete